MSSDIDRIAQERLAADEAITGSRKVKVTLRQTAAEFWRHPTPWMIGTLLAASVVWRVIEGDWRWSDLIGPAVLVALFPFIEWTIHVFVLHYRPRKVAGRMLDYQLARDHRRHHMDPRDIPLVFIPWQSLAVLAPIGITIALLAFPRLAQALSFIIASYITMFIYEWTHYLIHSDYKAKTQVLQGDLAQPPPAPLQERALLVRRRHGRHLGPGAPHQPRPRDGRCVTDSEEPARALMLRYNRAIVCLSDIEVAGSHIRMPTAKTA